MGATFSACFEALAPGDVVTVTRIDRLARSTFDLFAIVNQIVDAKAQFRSLAGPGAPGALKSKTGISIRSSDPHCQ
jgi:DNA invertase Pin-like site-specific DNA recombinase